MATIFSSLADIDAGGAASRTEGRAPPGDRRGVSATSLKLHIDDITNTNIADEVLCDGCLQIIEKIDLLGDEIDQFTTTTNENQNTKIEKLEKQILILNRVCVCTHRRRTTRDKCIHASVIVKLPPCGAVS